MKKTGVEASRWPEAGKLFINPQGAVLLVGYKKKGTSGVEDHFLRICVKPPDAVSKYPRLRKL